MKLRNFLLLAFASVVLFAASPTLAETLFFDDFENPALGTATNFGTDVTANPGTWVITGGPYDFRFAPSILSVPSVDGSGYYGSTIVGNSGTLHTYLNATFTPQSNVADLIRFDIDCQSLSAAATMEIAIGSGGSQYNSVALGSGSASWYHVTMEYYPGASTYDLTINGQPQTGLAMTAPTASVDSFYIHGTGGNWASFDNVSVTSVAPVQSIASGQVASPGGNAATFAASASIISGAPDFSGGSAPLYTPGWADWAQMTDGYVGPAAEATTCMLLESNTPVDPSWAVWLLDTTTNPAGYDIDSIESIAGFNQNRPWQNVEIKYALVGDEIVAGTELARTLGSYLYQPAGLGNDYNATMVTFDDGADAPMLTGVSAIQIKFGDNGFSAASGQSNFTAYREVSVIGAPTVVPEPSTIVLLTCGLVGLLVCAWKKRK